MPSSKAKAKNAAAHQHDKRHESGLAAPGKRVVRQRSNNSLVANGHLNGRPIPLADSLQPTSTGTATGVDYNHIDQTRSTDTVRTILRTIVTSKSSSGGGSRDESGAPEFEGARDRTNSDTSHDGALFPQGDTDDGQQDDAAYYSTADMARSRPGGYISSSDGSFKAVSTILTYYPLRDAISILILLLSLPATLVLLIQTLFASLTFVPPTASISLPSMKDLFNASSLGYPALATILFVDLLFYLCWLPLWRPVQDVFLDLSQAVVAVSLSGAAASTGGPTYSIVTCSALVCVVHVLRYKAIHLTALDYLRSVLHKTDLGINLSASFTSHPFFNNFNSTEHSWMYLTVRAILGIHIVSQGLTTCIRRSLANQNEKPAAPPLPARNDTASAISHDVNASRGISSNLDPIHQSSASSTPPNGATPHLARDARARDSGRRRRKQAIEIRGNQPLWAAIASTKVTFAKEMEQRDAADDVKEATTPRNYAGFARATAKSPVSRIWLTSVQDTEVTLSAELCVNKLKSSRHIKNETSQTRLFCVRVNGAVWNSIKAISSQSNAGVEHTTLEIYGLAPHTSYQCGIYTHDANTLLGEVNFVTQLAQTTEQIAPIALPVSIHPALRPSSPATTLRRSIEQTSASLAEAKIKTKKTRKDQRAVYSDIRKEIKDLKHKFDNGGGNDDKQNRRLQQFTQHKNQAEDAAVHILRQIGELGEVPSNDLAAADVSKDHWQTISDKRAKSQCEHDHVRGEADRELREVKGDISSAEQKHERLNARLQQRKDELTNAAAKHQADLTARQKHIVERAARRDEQEQLEAQLRFHIASMHSETEMHNTKAMEAYQQGQTVQGGWHDLSSPPTPDNARHVANGISQALSNGFYGTQHFDVAYAHPQQSHDHLARGRSMSMLSQYSGFTDEAEDGTIRMAHEAAWPHQKTGFGTAIIDVRKEGEVSSGSSGTNESTASSSPRPDVLARPFVPSRVSPIAPPARKTASPQTSAVASRPPTTHGAPSNNDR